MIITKIEGQRRQERVNIYLDGSFSFGLDREVQLKYGLREGMELDQAFIDEVLKDEEQKKVTNSALNFLSYMPRSEREVYNRLKQKGFHEDQIEKSIEFCKSKDYINDLNFAKSFINDKVNLNKFGSQRIRYELIKKGVSSKVIDQALDLEEDEEYERALELAEKKIYSYRKDDKMAKYRKLGGFLQRRGYSYGIVNRILKELID